MTLYPAWLKQTPAERKSYRDGLSLFFGALIGANLGTLEGLALGDYVRIVALLAGAVLALQLVTHARSRSYAVAMLGFYAVMLAIAYWRLDETTLRGVDLGKIFATFAVWLVAILIIELTPTVAAPADDHDVNLT